MTDTTSAAILHAASAGLPAPVNRWQQALRDLTRGFFIISHNGFALVGIAAMLSGTVLATQPDMRAHAADTAIGWLQQHQTGAEASEEVQIAASDAADPELLRALAADPKGLSRQQAAVTYWISKKYRVAPEPVARLVKEAYAIGQEQNFDPTLLLAVTAIESRFNPFAQSHVGAQGLMQVMTRIHSDKYDTYGGNLAAFDPVSNLRVGAQVLKETITRAGSLRGGLKHYVGAANLPTDQGYGDKVLGEYARLHAVAAGQTVAYNATLPLPASAETNGTARHNPAISAPIVARNRPATPDSKSTQIVALTETAYTGGTPVSRTN